MLLHSNRCSGVVWVSPWSPSSRVLSGAALTSGSVRGSPPAPHLLLPWGHPSPVYSWSPSVLLLCAGRQRSLGRVPQLGLPVPAAPAISEQIPWDPLEKHLAEAALP